MRWLSLIIAVVFCLILGLSMWKAGKFKQKNLEPIFMWIMLFGIFALCQPIWFSLYQYGFPILLTGAAGYTFVTHIK